MHVSRLVCYCFGSFQTIADFGHSYFFRTIQLELSESRSLLHLSRDIRNTTPHCHSFHERAVILPIIRATNLRLYKVACWLTACSASDKPGSAGGSGARHALQAQQHKPQARCLTCRSKVKFLPTRGARGPASSPPARQYLP
jgi:hypothetical protein